MGQENKRFEDPEFRRTGIRYWIHQGLGVVFITATLILYNAYANPEYRKHSSEKMPPFGWLCDKLFGPPVKSSSTSTNSEPSSEKLREIEVYKRKLTDAVN